MEKHTRTDGRTDRRRVIKLVPSAKAAGTKNDIKRKKRDGFWIKILELSIKRPRYLQVPLE